jgi:hypothetical protein
MTCAYMSCNNLHLATMRTSVHIRIVVLSSVAMHGHICYKRDINIVLCSTSQQDTGAGVM